MPSFFLLFFSVCLCPSATRGAVSFIAFMCQPTPREALSVATCSVNKCDYTVYVLYIVRIAE